MSPASPLVLGAAALVTSPALWDFAVEQTLALDQALLRYLVALAICWVLLSVLTEFALTPPPPEPAADDDAGDALADTALLDPRTP